MDEEVFNMQLRKFLKNVGITSQREIESAVRAALEDGTLKGDETVKTKVTLSIESLGVSTDIDGDIDRA
jgi:ribosomal protein L1